MGCALGAGAGHDPRVSGAAGLHRGGSSADRPEHPLPVAEAGGVLDAVLRTTVFAITHVSRIKTAVYVSPVLMFRVVRLRTRARRLRGCSHAGQMSPFPRENCTSHRCVPCAWSSSWLCHAQICNRWLTLRMQLISVVTQLIISMLVLVFRWPRDPGAPPAHTTVSSSVRVAHCVLLSM